MFFKERYQIKNKTLKMFENKTLCKLFIRNIAFVLKYISNLKQALQTGFGEIPKRPKGRPC